MASSTCRLHQQDFSRAQVSIVFVAWSKILNELTYNHIGIIYLIYLYISVILIKFEFHT